MFTHYKKILTLVICICAIYIVLPNFISHKFLLKNNINLGLDLRGGSSIVLQVDFKKYIQDKLDIIINEISRELKSENLYYISQNNEHIKLQFRDTISTDIVSKAVKNISDELVLNCAQDQVCKINLLNIDKVKKTVLADSISTVQRRVDESGTREASVQSQGSDSILVQVPGLEQPEQLKSLLGKTAKLTFHLLSDKKFAKVLTDKSGRSYPIKKRVELTGDTLNDASVRFSRLGIPVVLFKFNNTGARKFAQITKENVGKPFAIVLDDTILTVPVIREAITGGQGEISGNFTLEEANELAILLRSGSLPAPLNIIEERIVGPSLGAEAISAGINAAIISILVISVFMILVYGKLGLCSACALLANMLMIFAYLTLFEVTLTLPGIAGFVLTIGMAVDANVLIFERIKEELQHTSNVKVALNKGFKNAMTTIMDSNITTLIAALIMFFIGVGPVKGFAVTLAIGILSSMFSSVVITRQAIDFVKFKKTAS